MTSASSCRFRVSNSGVGDVGRGGSGSAPVGFRRDPRLDSLPRDRPSRSRPRDCHLGCRRRPERTLRRRASPRVARLGAAPPPGADSLHITKRRLVDTTRPGIDPRGTPARAEHPATSPIRRKPLRPTATARRRDPAARLDPIKSNRTGTRSRSDSDAPGSGANRASTLTSLSWFSRATHIIGGEDWGASGEFGKWRIFPVWRKCVVRRIEGVGGEFSARRGVGVLWRVRRRGIGRRISKRKSQRDRRRAGPVGLGWGGWVVVSRIGLGFRLSRRGVRFRRGRP